MNQKPPSPARGEVAQVLFFQFVFKYFSGKKTKKEKKEPENEKEEKIEHKEEKEYIDERQNVEDCLLLCDPLYPEPVEKFMKSQFFRSYMSVVFSRFVCSLSQF